LAAWTPLHDEYGANGGDGLALVCEPSSSPTEARLQDAFGKRFPKARVVVWAPLGDESRHDATDPDVDVVYHLDHARVILALDAHFLLHDRAHGGLAREFAGGRRQPDAMNRLYVAESALTITGIAADHRLALSSGKIAALTLALASQLGVPGAGGTAAD